MFSQSTSSKDDLIAILNTTTLTLNRRINELGSIELRDRLRSLLRASSTNDPYQFVNLQSLISEEKATLKLKLDTQTKCVGASGAVCALLCLSLASSNENKSGLATTLAFISAGFSAYELNEMHRINKEIRKLDNIENILNQNTDNNNKLARILQSANSDEMKHIRNDFYINTIEPINRDEQEKVNAEIEAKANKQTKRGFLFKWNLRRDGVVPTEVTYGQLPEIKISNSSRIH